jgi:hypothetical protein
MMLLFNNIFSSASPLTIGAFLGVLLLLALVHILVWVPLFWRMVTKKSQAFHQDVSSDIPGNPHAFDDLAICLFRTLPEPSNFNIVWTNVPLDDGPLVVRHGSSMPPARINSISVYAGADGAPASLDLSRCVRRSNGEVDVVIAKSAADAASAGFAPANTLAVPASATRAFMAMRNYLVPPGTRLVTPSIVRLSDGAVVRRAQALIAGPAACRSVDLAGKLSRCAIVFVVYAIMSALIYVRNIGFIISADYILNVLVFYACSAVVASALYHLLYLMGRRGLARFVNTLCTEDNRFYLASLDAGSKVSQPSALHVYYMMRFRVPEGSCVRICGQIATEGQKYWSCVIYDSYGLPIPQYVYDGNVKRVYKSVDNAKDVYGYDICLTRDGACGVNDDSTTHVDVSAAPFGYILFRLVHPTLEESSSKDSSSAPTIASVRGVPLTQFSMPSVTVCPSSACSCVSATAMDVGAMAENTEIELKGKGIATNDIRRRAPK